MADQRVWVLDTSSLRFITRMVKKPAQQKYLDHLSSVVAAGRLFCPPKVFDEILAYKGKDRLPAWVKKNRKRAARLGQCAEHMPAVMSNRAVAQCVDHRMANADHDPADPWVIATALALAKRGLPVTVVTQERDRYHGSRASLNVAAGSMGLPAINMESLLRDHLEVWDDKDHGSA